MSHGFQTTRWTLVLQAGNENDADRRAALSELLTANWYPLYSFLRRTGKPHQETEDLIQGFCLHIVEKNTLAGVSQRSRSRFRSYLLACLKNYVANQQQYQRAIKRGGDQAPLSLDFKRADERFSNEPAQHDPPEKAYDRIWALDLINRTLNVVATQWAEAGKQNQFEHLKCFLLGNEVESREQTAADLGITTNALKVTIHRLRAEFRRELCAQVAETLGKHDLLEDEISFLFVALKL